MANVIHIDMDKVCSKCGAEGALETGVCLTCAAIAVIDSYGADPRDKSNRRLLVPLTDAEIQHYGEEMAKTIIAKGKLEAERAVINQKIKPLVERIDELAPRIDSGQEEREVECRWYYLWEKGERHLIRLDLRELVDTDIVPEWERQQRMNFAQGAGASSEGDAE